MGKPPRTAKAPPRAKARVVTVVEASQSHAKRQFEGEVRTSVKDPRIAEAVSKSARVSEKPLTVGETLDAVRLVGSDQASFSEIASEPLPGRFKAPEGGPPAAKKPATPAASP